MSWDEFSDLIAGLNEQTSLVRVAQIRTESDPERLKEFTPEQRAMNTEWRRRRAQMRSETDVKAFMEKIQQALQNMFGE